MSEEAPAPAPAPAKAAKKKKTTASKPKKVGPSVGELIVKAVAASKERSGVSAAALKKALAAGGYDVDKNKARVKTAIKSLVAKGTLVQTKGTGASGSFKMNKKATDSKAKKPAKKAAPKAKKPAAAKAKKPAAAAKKSPKKAAAAKKHKNLSVDVSDFAKCPKFSSSAEHVANSSTFSSLCTWIVPAAPKNSTCPSPPLHLLCYDLLLRLTRFVVLPHVS
uniref:Histone H1 n=1 Tax=Oreochromis aureus TaxID=47969 RepID=A0AAZ1XNJ6_OREAU